MQEVSTYRPRILPPALAMLAAAVLNSLLLVSRTWLTTTAAVTVIYYACSLLSLFVTMVGMGSALFYLSRKSVGHACCLLWLAGAATLLPLLCAAILSSLSYPDYFADILVWELLSAIGSAALTTGTYFLLLLLCWLCFFRRASAQAKAPRLSLRRNRLGQANLLIAGLLFLYQAVTETVETVDFLSTYWPNVYRNEIASIIFAYVFILLSLLLGYLIQYGTQVLLHTPNE